MHHEVCAWHRERMGEKTLQTQILPSTSLHSSWQDKFVVCESLRAGFPYLGPGEHESSEILTSVNKKRVVWPNNFAKHTGQYKVKDFSESLKSSCTLKCLRGRDGLLFP